MKRIIRGAIAAMLLLSSAVVSGWAANTKTTIAQVTTTVNVENDVDYVISGATPFGEEGVVNIVNTEHAVLILNQVRPSAAIRLLSAHVKINGAKAVNNTNCQVKLYNRGAIILPYGTGTKPLTVYSEQNFGGESCNDFGLENSGGYMNTLTEAKLNNKIRSFRLKRGYMVTFALREGGRGYSRCFIAADKDLEVATLPKVMDQKISSYRVFKWYDAGKKQLANDLTVSTLEALNVQSSYTWSEGHDMAPDFECVPNHIYEDYPSSAAIGQATWSPHSKNNNEPKNSADDHPQDLTTILNNWENMMRTGMRLCSPASWDGSDYWNATGFLADFMDSIDARGWRCDIIDLHCYWPEGNFGNIANWVNKYKRPVWISEWCWGASWNNNGAFANGVTENQVKEALSRICSSLNNSDYVERYYYWNGERNPSRLYTDGQLTPAGQYYAQMNSGVGYNGKYDFVPKTPKQYGLSQFKQTVKDGKTVLSWYDRNGEFNELMEVQKKDETGRWATLEAITPKDGPSSYTYTIDSADENIKYRVHIIDLNGKHYYSSEELAAGDVVEMGEQTLYAGGNMVLNGDFDLGMAGWTSGTGAPLTEPQFQVVPTGGVGGGAYLQAHGTGTIDTDKSIKQLIDIVPGTNYFFRAATINGNANMRLSLTADGRTETQPVKSLRNSTAWERNGDSFNSETYAQAIIAFRSLVAKAQMDKIELRQLFATREEAVADGVAKARQRAELAMTCNTKFGALNDDLAAMLATISGTDDEALVAIETAIALHHRAVAYKTTLIDSLNNVLTSLATVGCAGYDEMTALLAEAAQAASMKEVIEKTDAVKEQIALYLDYTDAEVQPTSSTFTVATGWDVKVGTYTGGDQRTNTVGGKTCWNAWWSLSAKTNPDATMEIRQTMTGLKEGIYSMECKATTQHFCLTDQHGYLKYGEQTAVSPALTYDYFDLPVGNIWETLTTAPVFVDEGGTVTIGFIGSKQGAVDGMFHTFGNASASGDNREGWWCATDFVLKFHPAYKRKVEAGEWGTICLPYTMRPARGFKLYRIAGINPDYTQLCLEQIYELPAGEPCIYQAVETDSIFHEYGEALAKASTTLYSGNMRGFFVSGATMQANGFYLKDGAWERVGTTDRPTIENYTAFIMPFANKACKEIPVLTDWEGTTMPIHGVTEADKQKNEERIALDIDKPRAVTRQLDGVYSLDGRSFKTGSQLRSGLYIKVENGRAQKTVVK